MPARRASPVIAFVLASVLAALVVPPVLADTETELRSARARLSDVQAELDRLAAEFAAAQARLALTEDRIDHVAARIDGLRAEISSVQRQLNLRVREVYESGGVKMVNLLLSAKSLNEFSDRAAVLSRITELDSDLVSRAQVAREQLRRDEATLRRLSSEQAETVGVLGEQKDAFARRFEEQQDLVASLEAQLARERAAAAAMRARLAAQRRAEERAAARTAVAAAPAPSGPSGALQACPVGQPRAFTNDFGAPRSGGRTHQGIDLVAPMGTPVYAAQSGRFQQNSNALGGLSALVYSSNGDFTYYAHLSSYAGVASGASVSAGTLIGHVGNSGNASGGIPHLHFEYHPGGGGAANPYGLLVAVCG